MIPLFPYKENEFFRICIVEFQISAALSHGKLSAGNVRQNKKTGRCGPVEEERE